MSKIGERLLASAKQAREIAKGNAKPASIFVPPDARIDNSEPMGILPAGSQIATEPQGNAMIIPAMVGRGDPVRGQPEMTPPISYTDPNTGGVSFLPGATAAYIAKLEAALDKEQEAGSALTQVIAKLEAQVKALKLEEEKTFRVQEDRILALAAKNRELQARIEDLEAGISIANGVIGRLYAENDLDCLPEFSGPQVIHGIAITDVNKPANPFWNAANWRDATWVDDDEA